MANAIVGKTELIQELKDMPDNGYAVLVLMKPADDGVYLKSVCYPPGLHEIMYEGILNHAGRFLAWKTRQDG
jgi:hypothetical protein